MSDNRPAHTPLPWRVGYDAHGQSRPIINAPNHQMLSVSGWSNGRWGPYDNEDDDAALIVRAVNHHEALVEMLRRVVKSEKDSAGGCLGCGRDSRVHIPAHDRDCLYAETEKLLAEIDAEAAGVTVEPPTVCD